MLFSRQSEVQKWKIEQNLKIQDGGLLLPWKPIWHYVVSLNWKNKWSLLYVPNFKSIGWIVSNVEGGSDFLPPFRASCNYFFFEASRVYLENQKTANHLFFV